MRTMRLPRTAGPAVSVSIVCLALVAVAELWLARRGGPAFVVAVVIAGLAVVWATVLLSVRPKPAAASGNGSGTANRSLRSSRRRWPWRSIGWGCTADVSG